MLLEIDGDTCSCSSSSPPGAQYFQKESKIVPKLKVFEALPQLLKIATVPF